VIVPQSGAALLGGDEGLRADDGELAPRFLAQ
jgi:hypothetical protein